MDNFKTANNANVKMRVLALQELKDVSGGKAQPEAWSTTSNGCGTVWGNEWSTMSNDCRHVSPSPGAN